MLFLLPSEPRSGLRSAEPGAYPPTDPIHQVLAWLPADTETVIAANGPFRIKESDEDFTKEPNSTPEDELEQLPLGLFGFKNSIFIKHFSGENVLLSLEGSRHFRAPAGLGESPFEGCAIVVFERDVTSPAAKFLRASSSLALRTEQIEGVKVEVFQEQMENDTWTTFLAFPQPRIAVAASDTEYLRVVLARLNGKTGPRALPDDLPEWNHVALRADVWAVRHYAKNEPNQDPSSPFIRGSVWHTPEPQAIGLTFSFKKGEAAKVTYLSADPNALAKVQPTLSLPFEQGARNWRTSYRQPEAGIVEASFNLERGESAWLFGLLLCNLLGHSIFV